MNTDAFATSGKLRQMTEQDLVAAARDGDRHAFSDLMDTVVPEVFPIALAILRNRQDAEDAVQESVIAAIDNLGKLRDPGTFRAWFSVIVANRARSALRKRGRDIALESVEHTMPALAHASDRSIDIRDAVASLPDLHQQAIFLYFSGFKTREVAEMLGRPRGTVKRVLSESYRILRNSLGPDYDYRNQRYGT